MFEHAGRQGTDDADHAFDFVCALIVFEHVPRGRLFLTNEVPLQGLDDAVAAGGGAHVRSRLPPRVPGPQGSYLADSFYLLVLESQVPNKIVNSLFTITN